MGATHGRVGQQHQHQPSSSFTPFDGALTNEFGAPGGPHPPLPHNGSHTGYRTAQEVEEEMRIAALRAREIQLREVQLREAQLREQQQLEEQYERIRLQELQALQQRGEFDLSSGNTGTRNTPPPPRMHPHAQSPRFHHQLQQQILVQQQREQARDQHAFNNISAQLRAEELARQRELAGPQQRFLVEQQLQQQQRIGSPAQLDPRLAVELQQLRRASPAFDPHIQQLHAAGTPGTRQGQGPGQQPFLPDDIQVQQIMLRRTANDEFMREMVGSEQVGRRIMEAERMEEKRRRKAAKISHMVRSIGSIPCPKRSLTGVWLPSPATTTS